jgi:hypothetical protein
MDLTWLLLHTVAAPFEARADGPTIIERLLIHRGSLSCVLGTDRLDLLLLRLGIRGITGRPYRRSGDSACYRTEPTIAWPRDYGAKNRSGDGADGGVSAWRRTGSDHYPIMWRRTRRTRIKVRLFDRPLVAVISIAIRLFRRLPLRRVGVNLGVRSWRRWGRSRAVGTRRRRLYTTRKQRERRCKQNPLRSQSREGRPKTIRLVIHLNASNREAGASAEREAGYVVDIHETLGQCKTRWSKHLGLDSLTGAEFHPSSRPRRRTLPYQGNRKSL